MVHRLITSTLIQLQALELDPKYVKAWAKKGDIEFFMKEYHKALDSYKKVGYTSHVPLAYASNSAKNTRFLSCNQHS